MQKLFKHINVLLVVATVSIMAIILLTSCGAKPAASSVQEVTLEGVHLKIAGATLDQSFPAGCTGEAPGCTQARNGYKILSVAFQPRDLPEGQMLAYKNLPSVSVTVRGGKTVPHSLFKYDNVTHILTLGFEVSESASAFGLKWADLAEIPLEVAP